RTVTVARHILARRHDHPVVERARHVAALHLHTLGMPITEDDVELTPRVTQRAVGRTVPRATLETDPLRLTRRVVAVPKRERLRRRDDGGQGDAGDVVVAGAVGIGLLGTEQTAPSPADGSPVVAVAGQMVQVKAEAIVGAGIVTIGAVEELEVLG